MIAPPLAGLTDQASENPRGGLGEAVNAVVDPGATVVDEGLTIILSGKGLGFGNPLSDCPPPPHDVQPEITARATRTCSIPFFACEETSAPGVKASCAIYVVAKALKDFARSSKNTCI